MITWLAQTEKLQATALYTPAEAAAAFAALKTLADTDIPWYARAQVTDDLLNAIVATALTAAAKARQGGKS